MNFMPATLTNEAVHLPMVDVKLPREVRERIGRQSGTNLIAGIRPEDFEDAATVDSASRERGAIFQAKLDLVEAMGAEYYAHFGVHGRQFDSAELHFFDPDSGQALTNSD